MKLFLIRNPVLTSEQFERISNIFDNAGNVVFGVAVLAPLFSGFTVQNMVVSGSSIMVMLACWSISVWLAKKGKK